MRAGMHGNSAFACILALDYARVAGDTALAAAVEAAARKWFLADRDAPLAYEPSQADFLSPALTEAQLMREVLAPREFRAWLAAFLPAGLRALSAPAVPPDRSDPQFCHLDGLSLSRAWALRRIAAALSARRSGCISHSPARPRPSDTLPPGCRTWSAATTSRSTGSPRSPRSRWAMCRDRRVAKGSTSRLPALAKASGCESAWRN